MKKQIALVAGLAVLAAPAFASKARLQALGEDINGSQFINDNRNIFLNAAAVNDHKDLVTFEWGSSPAVTDTEGTPRAEGGFFKAHGNMVYGVQLGGQSDSAHAFRLASGIVQSTALAENNGIDVFVGGDAGVKWGASLFYSSSENGDDKQDSMRVRLGASQNNWNVFANVNISNDAEGAAAGTGTREFAGDQGFQVGGSYMMNEYTFFAKYQSLKGEAKGTGGIVTTTDDIEATRMEIGVGREMKLNDKATLFTSVKYQTLEAEGGYLADIFNGRC
jgi:hypothetical protein